MNKKLVALAAVVVLVSVDACAIKKTVKSDVAGVSGGIAYSATVVAVQLKTGQRMEFGKKAGATIKDDKVVIPTDKSDVTVRLKLLNADIKDVYARADHDERRPLLPSHQV